MKEDSKACKKIVDFLNDMAERGFFLECGTLVFSKSFVDCQGLHIVVNNGCDDE